MKATTVVPSGVIVLLMVLLSFGAVAKPRATKPLIWNLDEVKRLTTTSGSSVERQKILREADSISRLTPIAITQKKNTFAPDAHYYCSIGIYWWPDPEHPGKYVNKDGQVNPEIKEFDNTRFYPMVARCMKLAEAYYISKDKRYYDSYIQQINTWFLNVETYMYPSFEYAQVIPGQNGNKGRSTGMIDGYPFNDLIESIRLVNSIKEIDRKTLKALQSWFADFATWADDSYGAFYKKIDKNTSLAFDVTLANMYLFAGDEAKAKEIVDEFAALRIEKQILEDGTQPSELLRTKAFSYAVFNLSHIIDMCYLARYWYPNYYQEHRERIDKAFEFLGHYVNEPEQFPYQQITSWEQCKKDYNKQLGRLNVLRGNGNN